MKTLNGKWLNGVFLVIGLALISYSAFRAHQLSFTYDESSTVLEFAGRSYFQIFSEAPTANNHVLNTALIKFFRSFLPAHELSYRLPNVLAHLIYIMFSFLLVCHLKQASKWFMFLGFLLLNLNPYLLDFFSLARGYGLAAAFTLGTLYFLVRWLEKKDARTLIITFSCALLAVLSNFSLLNLLLALTVIVSTQLIFNHQFEILKKTGLIVNFGFLFLTAALIFAPIKQLLNREELFFGGGTGLWTDTLMSLVEKSMYGHFEGNEQFAAVAIASIALLLLIWFTVQIFRRNERSSTASFVQISGLLILVLLGIQLQHWFFGTRFIMERTALFLIPIFLLAIYYGLVDFHKKYPRAGTSILAALTLISVGNTAMALNLGYVLDWQHERETKSVIISLAEFETPYETHLGVVWPYSVSANFYRQHLEYTWLRVVEMNGPADEFTELEMDMKWIPDEALAGSSELDGMMKVEKLSHLYRTSATQYSSELIFQQWTESEESEWTSDEFTNLFSRSLRDARLNLRFDLDVKLKSESGKPHVELIFANELGTIRKAKPLNRPDENGWHHLSICYRGSQTVPSDLAAYVWNLDRAALIMKNFRVTTFTDAKNPDQ